MGRDLLIYGIESNKLITFNNDLESIIFNKDIVNNKEYIAKEIVNQLDAIEYEDEKFQDIGITEIAWHGSRQICYCVCQLLDEIIENSLELSHIIYIDDGLEMILSKQELLIILDWLIITSKMLAFKEGELEKPSMTPKIDNLIKNLIQEGFFRGKEFEWYSWEYNRFGEWKSEVIKTNYNFYWWVDSI